MKTLKIAFKMIKFIMLTVNVFVADGINLETCDLLLFFSDIAVLGVSLTERSMENVKKAFLDIATKLNLSESLPMQNLQSVPKVKDYLMENHLRFCALVIDADRIKSDHEHQPEESRDYQQLLETAVNHVGKIRQLLLRSVIQSRQTRAILCTNRVS